MKIVRVTMLESFRRFRDNVTETYDTEEKLIETITGKFTGNSKTIIGSAFHSIIENYGTKNQETEQSIFKKFGVKFSNEQIAIAQTHALNIAPFIPEIRSHKQYGNIIVSGAIDALQGNVIRDTKTKFRDVTVIDYLNSYQWRFYLDIFGLDRFVYDIFEFKEYKENYALDVSLLQLKKHDPFSCVSYDNMQKDIFSLVNDFSQWADFRKIWPMIPDF